MSSNFSIIGILFEKSWSTTLQLTLVTFEDLEKKLDPEISVLESL